MVEVKNNNVVKIYEKMNQTKKIWLIKSSEIKEDIRTKGTFFRIVIDDWVSQVIK